MAVRKGESGLEGEVERRLREGGFKFEKEVVLGSARPDFVVTTADGQQFVIEVKDWPRGPENIGRALHQAQLYMDMSGADGALVVTPATAATVLSGATGIAHLTGFADALERLASGARPSSARAKRSPTERAPQKKVFASMPFAAKYDDTFLVAIEPAALNNNAVAERVDHNGSAGPVVPQIKTMIQAAKVIIADLSESRPNVLHEVGFAEALKKPIVQICSTSTQQLPFNVRNNQTIRYTIGQTAKLKKLLEAELAKHI